MSQIAPCEQFMKNSDKGANLRQKNYTFSSFPCLARVYLSIPPSFPGLIEKLGVVHLQTWWETTNFVLRPFLGRGGKEGGGDGDRGGR